jgi:acyl-CoA synthetase (AMP-forming)/AMP-acid ligase II
MDMLSRFTSPFDAFTQSAASSPETPFLAAPASAALPYARDGFRHSYGAVATTIAALQAEYAAAGYGRGARVALMLGNRPEFFLHWLALNALGAAIVPLNADLRPDELTFQLTMARTQILVAATDHMSQLHAADLPCQVIEHGAKLPPHQGDILGQSPQQTDECALLFTSGSTGKPKGCLLSNRYFLQVAAWFHGQGGIAAMTGGPEINLTPLPMFHMNALGCSAVGMMAIGGTVVPLDRFHASTWWESVADSGATMVHCLGVIPAILLRLPPSEAEQRHVARFAFAPSVDVGHRAQFESRFRLPIVDAWAMTETGGAAATTTAREPAGYPARCIGRPAPGMDYQIVTDAGAPITDGQPGELLVRSAGPDPRAGFFSGYLDDEAATEEAWAGGWFHTGDYVRAEPDGLLYFFDRKKSIVRRSGENIAVLEVETVLHRLPEVEATAVTPVPDDLRGEEVFAYIIRSPDAPPPDAALALQIMRACAADLAYHKLPGYVAFVTSLPLSATRKLARGDIKALAAQALKEGAAFDLREAKARIRKDFFSEEKKQKTF